MEPWRTPALTGYSCEDFPSRTTRSRLLLRKEEIRPNLTWYSIRLKFVKKTSMPNPVKSLGYIKCHSSSSPRPVKSPSNSIINNCKKIWDLRSKTILEIRKKALNLFNMKITASVTKTLHQDSGPSYLHLPIVFFYIHSSLLQQSKNLLRSLISLAN